MTEIAVPEEQAGQDVELASGAMVLDGLDAVFGCTHDRGGA